MKRLFRDAFIATLPIMVGYLVLACAFGLLMNSHGFSVLWVFAMSLFIYAGSLQFLAVDLITGTSISLITVAITSFMINARHIFYGISMLDRYKDAGKKKPYLIFALTDETYSLVCTGYKGAAEEEHDYYFFVSLLAQCYWVVGSIIGCLIGELLPFTILEIDFALTALFVTVFFDQWINSISHFSAITGVVCSIICLLLFGATNFLIPAMISILVILSVAKVFKRGEE